MKLIIEILKLLVVSALLFFLLSFTIKNENKDDRKINLIQLDSSQERFLSENDITNITDHYNNFNISEIEKTLRKIPQIKDAKVYVKHSGDINIEVIERIPVLRLFDNTKTYYLDSECVPMPTSNSFTSRKLLVSGDLDIYSNTEICNLYSIINSNDFYQSLITQVNIQKNNITLITRIKNFEINIGDLNMLETKFENLLSFYDRIIKFKGWNYYNKVNLKYVDQIICSKK